MARYVIGIDLGTTNSALAYSEAESPAQNGATYSAIETLPVPQVVSPGDVSELDEAVVTRPNQLLINWPAVFAK